MKKGQTSIFVGIGIVVLAVIVLVIAMTGIDYVPAGHIGVMDTMGNVADTPWGPGIKWTGVFTDTVSFSTRVQLSEYMTTAASKDMQIVQTSIALNYKVNSGSTPEIYKTIGENYQDVIIAPVIQEAVKSSTSKYNAEALITDRASIKADITDYITNSLLDKGLLVTEVAITDFQFSPEFSQAIERKQVAEQDALTAENEFRAMEWTSASMELQTEVLEIKQLDLQQQWITKWNGKMPGVYVMSGEDSGMMFPIMVETTE